LAGLRRFDETVEMCGKVKISAEIARAERLRRLWLKYQNRYPVSQRERDALIKEWGI
jgi:hypothetical protein